MSGGSFDQEKLLAQFFAELTKTAVKATGAAVGGVLQKLLDTIRKDFRAYLKATLTRCSEVKTILHRDEPIPLSSIYVTTRLKCGNTEFDDFSFLESIPKIRDAVIVGTAGSGKSMFMRYVFMSIFERSGGKVPVFIELRQMNSLQSKDLVSFMFHSVVSPGAVLSPDQFKQGLKSGLFFIIFDGFDEVDFDWRKDLEAQILKLRDENPGNVIIVSSRPDDRFDSWASFRVFRVQPMAKKQVLALLNKLDYDQDVRRKFIKTLKAGLYERHQSFLSNPLLAIMMLITFDQFAQIPEKVHIFYEHAFDALFFRHDASKHAGYRRKIRSGLAIDDFKNSLSAFCMLTYAKEKTVFSDSEFRENLKKALAIEKKVVSIDDFLNDLLESVCIFQRDGLEYTFTHRSFQEYFSAAFISRGQPVALGSLLDQLCRRQSDSVIPMVFDMNRTVLEREWVIPRLKDLIAALSPFDLKTNLIGHFHVMFGSIAVYFDGKHHRISVVDYTLLGHVRFTLMTLYSALYAKVRAGGTQTNPRNQEAFKNVLLALRERGDPRLKPKDSKNKKGSISFELRPEDNIWLGKTWLSKFAAAELRELKNLLKELQETHSKKQNIIDDMFR